MSTVGDISVRLGLDMRDFQQGLTSAERTLKSAGDKFKTVGESLSKAFTIPLMAVSGVSLSSASDVQKSQALIQAQLGLTSKEASKLQGSIKSLFKEGFGESLEEVTRNITNIKRNIKSMADATDDELKKVAKSTMNLATAFDQDVNDITKSINGLQVAFKGMGTEKAFDLITKGFQSGLDYSNEFLDVVSEYSVYFSKLGYSSEQMFAIFNKGAETGAFQLDKIGMLMQEFNIRLSDGTADEYMENLSKSTRKLYDEFKKTGKGGSELFQAIMRDISNLDNETQAYTVGVGIMGTPFEDLEKTAITALANISDEFTNVTGATEELNNAMNKDIGTLFKSTLREMTSLLEPFAIILAELIQKYLPQLTEQIQKVSEWFNGLSDKTKLTIIAVTGLTAILPILIIGIGMLISSVGTIIGAFSSLVGIMGGVSVGVASMIGILGVLVVAFIDAYKTSETFRQNVNKVLEFLTPAFKVAFNLIKEIVIGTFNNIKNIITGIMSVFSGLISFISNLFTGQWALAWESFKQIVLGAFQIVWNWVQVWGVGKILGLLGDFVKGIKPIFNKVTDYITSPFKSAYDTVIGWIEKIKDGVKNMFNVHIKVPTFSVTGSLNPAKWLSEGLPKINISWNAKGNIFTGATLLGGGQGVGEAGAEAVIPLQRKRYMKPFASMVADLMVNDSGVLASSRSGITQNITINSPEPLTPSEVARQTLNSSRRLAMEWGLN